MQFKFKNTKITISFTFFALILLLIVFRKTDFLCVSVISAILHELGHLFALKIFDAEILEFKLSLFGGNIKTDNFKKTNYIEDLIISFSGPLVNLFISIFGYFLNLGFQSTKIVDVISINAILALFNLLPFYNFDGGKMVECIIKNKCSENFAKKIITLISFAILIPFTYCSVLIFLNNRNNFYYLIVSLLMLLTIILKK